MKYIQSAKNAQVKQWKKLLTKKGRDEFGTYLLEGFHLVEEALKYKEDIVELIMNEEVDLPHSWDYDEVSITMVSKEVAKALSDTGTTQGVFAICNKQSKTVKPNHGTYLLLDGVQDPGNIGTMIRTADASGIDAVILGNGTVDLYNPKLLRSAQGSHFHLNVFHDDISGWIEECKSMGIPIYGTSLEDGVEYRSVSPQKSFALIVGNEGNGVSEEILQKTDQNLYIPIRGRAESLNVSVAAGVLLYHLKN
ncbi:TrmH family RNA methyltransferase [Bacillus pakistanensis]|uniref:TrmH family RNA methyltransferase n=1 Tax=Rossellomorea pakistanensis TaxID=992288 RepID=A0ABS2NAW2_9BACI|nr:RNA methyltransferase [Bacillus pakistanensis]MBM7584899.1 TrmH family RNA methyltransferase [Bacillus pakistanensis]